MISSILKNGDPYGQLEAGNGGDGLAESYSTSPNPQRRCDVHRCPQCDQEVQHQAPASTGEQPGSNGASVEQRPSSRLLVCGACEQHETVEHCFRCRMRLCRGCAILIDGGAAVACPDCTDAVVVARALNEMAQRQGTRVCARCGDVYERVRLPDGTRALRHVCGASGMVVVQGAGVRL